MHVLKNHREHRGHRDFLALPECFINKRTAFTSIFKTREYYPQYSVISVASVVLKRTFITFRAESRSQNFLGLLLKAGICPFLPKRKPEPFWILTSEFWIPPL
jgi:hypothetical protein